MRAVVLCAGLGTRLRPVTERWPKPAVPLLGQALLRYTLATLAQAKVRWVGINTHHLPDVMAQVAAAEAARAGLELEVRHEPEIQGTGGGIRGFRDALRGERDFLVVNGDVLFTAELATVVQAHRASGAAATMALLPMPRTEAYAAVEIDEGWRVHRIAGRGPAQGPRLTPWHFTGVHVMSPAVFDFMTAHGPEDINREVYLRMIGNGQRLHGHCLDAAAVHWSDLGTPERYAATHQQILYGQVSFDRLGAASPFASVVRRGPYWAPPSFEPGDVRVAGPAWFGEGCQLGPGVRVGAAVSVGPGACIGAGAALNRAIILDGAVVEPSALVEDALVLPPERGAPSRVVPVGRLTDRDSG